jgi:ribosome biogenesis GTPase A
LTHHGRHQKSVWHHIISDDTSSKIEKAKLSGTASDKELTTTVMVVGMPNVGKSSLINSLRRIGVKKGKAAPTGAIPGITRTVAGTIKVLDSPKVYLIDTPGVMIPHIADPISAIKVALTGIITSQRRAGIASLQMDNLY